MAFSANKREWSELYLFFRLLSEGKLYLGNHRGEKNNRAFWPIAVIERVEHDGPRRYYIEDELVRVEGKGEYLKLNRAALAAISDKILDLMKSSSDEEIKSTEDLEAFLYSAQIFDLEPETSDRTDIKIAFWNDKCIPTGFMIQSKLAPMRPLIDGGRTANLKMELTGARLASPEVSNVNALETNETVRDRMLFIERIGGILKFSDVADKVFRCNLQMIDLHFARVLAEALRIFHLDGKSRVYEVMNKVKKENPIKIKEDLIQKHRYYEYKMKQFLMILVCGMRPAKIFDGTDSAVEGMLVINGDGSIIGYHKNERKTFEDFLYLNTRFEKGSLHKDRYGSLEREHGTYFFKLNVKIGLTKR